MGIAIDLQGTGGSMVLRMEEGTRWCRCFLSGRSEQLIGGQALEYVIHHLLDALGDPEANPAGEIEGHPVYWVMSLSSPHVSVYSAEVDQDRWFFFQNAEANIIRVIVLTPGQEEQWKRQLNSTLAGLGRV